LALRGSRPGAAPMDVANAHEDVALALASLGRNDESIAELEAALAIKERIAPGTRPTLVTAGNLANSLTAAGRFGRAGPRAHKPRPARLLPLAPAHVRVAMGHRQLAAALTGLGRVDEAADELAAARASYVARFGERNADVAWTYVLEADLAWNRGRTRSALALTQRAHDILGEVLPPAHERRIRVATILARRHFALGSADKAIALAEGAVAQADATQDPHALAEAQFALAEILWGSGRGRPRAVELARASVAAADPRTRADVEAWLAKHDR